MTMFTTREGVEIFYKDHGEGQPVVLKTLIERGFSKPGDAENRLGDFMGPGQD